MQWLRDGLRVIDVSDPANPRVLGELKIPGFSDYMHPLGADHLLTIGRDIDEETQRDNGTALQIFDVSKPTEPRLAHKALGSFFETFGVIHTITSGGPQQATTILVYKVYADGFVGQDLGSSAAQSVILLFVVGKLKG